jgi:hypothetical protein
MTAPIICCAIDVSGSMDTPVNGRQRRRDVCDTTLARIVPDLPNVRLVAFNDTITVLEPGQPIPEPSGGTNLALALERIAAFRPSRVVIVSDGEPQDKAAALAAAQALRCVISTYFCGSEDDRAGAAFMKQLALCSRGGVGRALKSNLREPEKLAGELRLLLGGPSR